MKVIIKTLKKMPKHTRGKPGAGKFTYYGEAWGSKRSIELEAELSLCWSHPGKNRKTPGFEKDGFWRILVSQDSSLTDAAVG